MTSTTFAGLPLDAYVALFAIAALVDAVIVVLARASRRELLAVACIVALGIVLRLVFSPATLLDMSNYWREPAVFPWLADRGLPIYALFPDGLDRFQVFSALNLACSAALPLLLYCLAEVMFGQRRVALSVAVLAAICPMQIYFAASESMFISSNAASVATFLLLHSAFAARRMVVEVFYALGCIALYAQVTVDARQVNFLFGALAVVAAIWNVMGGGPGRWRKALWAVPLVELSVRHFLDTTTSIPGVTVGAGSLAERLEAAWPGWSIDGVLDNLRANDYLRPSLYPLGITLLAVTGALRLLIRQPRHLFYLVAFFAIFYVGHVSVHAWDETAAARYGLQSAIPILLAAAFGLDAAVSAYAWATARSPRWALAGGAAVLTLVLATFVPASTLYRLPPSDIQEEYAFLRALAARGLPEPGALVIEPDVADVGRTSAGIGKGPRFAYFGRTVSGAELVQSVGWARCLPAEHDGPVYLYIGLPCFFMRPPAEPIAGACAELLRAAEWELVDEQPISGRRHDTSNGFAATGHTIALYRMKAP